MAKFKYQDQLALCTDQPCPNGKYEERECVGYRWVHEPPWPDDFNPAALVRRGGSRTNERAATSCGNYALSFFKTADHARSRWKNLEASYDVATLFGTHAVRIALQSKDGRSSRPSSRWKHFDLHEYDGDRCWFDRIDERAPMTEEGAKS